MKVSDEEILTAIWRHQVNRLAGNVVHHYIGGSYGLCRDDDFWFVSSLLTCTVSRHLLGVNLSNGHLLRRLKALHADGRLLNEYGAADRLGHFYIGGALSRSAFEAARTWWLDHGMPEGTENGAFRTEPMTSEELEAMTEECRHYLLERYGDLSIDAVLREQQEAA